MLKQRAVRVQCLRRQQIVLRRPVPRFAGRLVTGRRHMLFKLTMLIRNLRCDQSLLRRPGRRRQLMLEQRAVRVTGVRHNRALLRRGRAGAAACKQSACRGRAYKLFGRVQGRRDHNIKMLRF